MTTRAYKIIVAAMALVIAAQWAYMFTMKRAAPPAIKPATIKEAPKTHKPVPLRAKGTVAIVLDDWGYNVNNLPALDEIPYALTIAVLPNLPYSRTVGATLHGRGREIILHCPMEPLQKVPLEKNTILTTMDSSTIKKILDHNISTFPYIRGISNHMGSRATEDNRTMQIIMSELKAKKLYFLDSFVTARSVAESESFKAGVSFVKRDIFLDNNPDPEYIKQQIYKVLALAQRNGTAVAIGHDRKNTLEVLRQVLPEAAKNGYRFVNLSELVK